MEKLEGVLIFSGAWANRPWSLTEENGREFDIFMVINMILQNANGKPVTQEYDNESYTLRLDESSEYTLRYKKDERAVLEGTDKSGFSSVCGYMTLILTMLSGRKIKIELSDAGFKISATDSEEVHGVKYFGDGNSCRIEDGDEKAVCKIGTDDCCIFTACGADGFTCQKFSSWGSLFLSRHAEGTMKASRVGNCAVIGREEGTVAA